MDWRFAEDRDFELLSNWNRELQEDEGASVIGVREIEARLRKWLESDYEAVLFNDDGLAGYALYRPTDPDSEGAGGIYLRQFFVDRNRRRRGRGAKAFDLFVRDIIGERRLVLEVLASNQVGQAFWRSRGLAEYCMTYELV